MEILNFFIANWSSVLLVIAALIISLALYLKGEKRILFAILYALVTEAERQYGSGTGELKKATVTAKIYAMLPAIVRIIITEARLSELIEEALAYAKERWAANAAIAGYIGAGEAKTDPP